jgi:signal transduction histidine kinase
MTPFEPVIFLVSADAALTQQLVSTLLATGGQYQLPVAVSVSQARKVFRRIAPVVILLDESAVGAGRSDEPLEAAVAQLTEFAPVVVVGAPEQQSDLASLIASGAVDFVARVGDFLPVAVGLLERRVRMTEQRAQEGRRGGHATAEPGEDFGEVLRHEVNNPLTGILGNAELLLAECKKKNGQPLPIAAVQRLQTIAELAVRLRETVRRLSNAWESRNDHARSA